MGLKAERGSLNPRSRRSADDLQEAQGLSEPRGDLEIEVDVLPTPHGFGYRLAEGI